MDARDVPERPRVDDRPKLDRVSLQESFNALADRSFVGAHRASHLGRPGARIIHQHFNDLAIKCIVRELWYRFGHFACRFRSPWVPLMYLR